MKMGSSGVRKSLVSRTLLGLVFLGCVLFASASASPTVTSSDDCRDDVAVRCCEYLTMGVECIFGDPVGGCVAWEPPCCDEFVFSGGKFVNRAAANGHNYTASSYDLHYVEIGSCPYRQPFCNYNLTPVCQHSQDIHYYNCWNDVLNKNPTPCSGE